MRFRIACALAFTGVVTAQPKDGDPSLPVRTILTGSAVDFKTAITPDGRLMAMTDLASGDIALRDMLTGQVKRLEAKRGGWESDDFGDYVTLSPDQRQVAYVWHEGSNPGYLRLMPNQPGAKPRTLVRNPEFSYILPVAWSPDAKSILVHIWKKDYTAQVAWVAVGNGAIQVLKSLDWRLRGKPILSPDGHYIAYSAVTHANSLDSHIYILDSDGSTEIEAVSHAGVNTIMGWTPDGSRILYTNDRAGAFDLWSVGVGNAVEHPTRASLVKSNIGKILPVGVTSSGSLVYVHEQGGEDIFLAGWGATTGQALGPVTKLTDSGPGTNTGPAWSSDGNKIAFKRRNQGNRGGYDLVVRSLDTGEEKTYVSRSLAGVPAPPIWFKGGESLLVAMRDRQERIHFQRVDLASGEFIAVLPSDSAYLSAAALSPDEKTLYVIAPDTSRNTSGIAAFNLATGDYRQVLRTPGFINNFALSPDGRSLAVARSVVTDGHWVGHLTRVEIEGGGLRDLYVPEPGTPEQDVFGGGPMLAWTADGSTILFSTGSRDSRLLSIPAEGGIPAFTGIVTAGLRHDVVGSPDGARIAFSHGYYSVREIREIDLAPLLESTKK